MTVLGIYLTHASSPDRLLTLEDLEAEGHSRSYAHVLLHRLCKEGAAERVGQGQVRLVKPGDPPLPVPREEPWKRALKLHFKTKETGFSALPQRYPGPKPAEYLVPPSRLRAAAAYLRSNHSGLRVVEDRYASGDNAVCLYPGRVRGDRASTEEALLHVYRHAPRDKFALALQAVLMQNTDLDWRRLRQAPEWPELAGLFCALDQRLGTQTFPRFRNAELPDLSYAQLDTVAQAFTARSGQ